MEFKQLNTVEAADAGAWLTVLDEDGNDTDFRIRLLGKDSKTWKSGEHQFGDKRLQQMQKTGKMGNITTAQVEDRGIKLLAAVTVEWVGLTDNGQPVPCTREKAEQLYRLSPGLAEQVDAFVGDRKNFGKPEAEKSEPSVFDSDAHVAGIVGN